MDPNNRAGENQTLAKPAQAQHLSAPQAVGGFGHIGSLLQAQLSGVCWHMPTSSPLKVPPHSHQEPIATQDPGGGAT